MSLATNGSSPGLRGPWKQERSSHERLKPWCGVPPPPPRGVFPTLGTPFDGTSIPESWNMSPRAFSRSWLYCVPLVSVMKASGPPSFLPQEALSTMDCSRACLATLTWVIPCFVELRMVWYD